MPAERVTRPASDPRAATGIVHLGLGAFFRAFGCVHVADAMAASGGAWGITGVSLRSPVTRDALRPQGWAYTVVTLGPDSPSPRLITVLNEVLVAPEAPQAVLRAMTDPRVHIVSLTVTEKGYCHNPSTGSLDLTHPDIIHDLASDTPRSAIGFIARALQVRRTQGIAPFTVLSCDNLPANGKLARALVLDFARHLDPKLADWIARNGRFPGTMVDRITPATTAEDIARLTDRTGLQDAAPVMTEPFSQWAIEDDFVGGQRPDFAAAGAEMVADVTAHETMKLRMLNGTHSALAYTGYLAGHDTVAQTVADPVFQAYARRLWAEIIPTVTAPQGVDLHIYAETLMARYQNPAIRHKTAQIAMDGSQKLPQRVLGTLHDRLSAGQPSPALCLAVAAWMRYVSGVDDAGNHFHVEDPLANRLIAATASCDTPEGKVAALLGLSDVFAPGLASLLQAPVTRAAQDLWENGTRLAVERIIK